MDFFNKLGDSIQNVGKEASKKAKDLSGTVTLNSQIKETETQLERIYKLIGEKYYMAYREEAAERFPEENDELIKLQNKLEEDKKQLRALKGLKVIIRPHPSQIEEILKKNIIKIDYIENPKDISIFDSINKTDKIVSRFSTVLFQAYSMNKKIVIDNVSDIEQYNKLKEVGYIMIEKEHELLSDIL